MTDRFYGITLSLILSGTMFTASAFGQQAEQVDQNSYPVCDDAFIESSSYYVQPLSGLSTAMDINNMGVVVGAYGRKSRVYENLTYRDVEVPGAFSTGLWAINDEGQIGGRYDPPGGDDRGFTMTDTTYTTIDFPGASKTIVAGISNDGDVAGGYFSPAIGWIQGFMKTTYGPYVSIDFPGARATFANSINRNLEVVGFYSTWSGQTNTYEYHGFVYSAGGISSIDVPGAARTEAIEISDDGMIFGFFVLPDETKGVFTKSDTGFQIQDHPLPSAVSPGISGWNNNGQITGWVSCYIDPDLPYTTLIGFLATPALRPQIEMLPARDSLDISKKNPVMIALLSNSDFDAVEVAASVVLLPREWIWGSNDLEGGTLPLRYLPIDVNHDGRLDALFFFPREALRLTTENVTGVMLKGTMSSGELFVGIKHIEILNQWEW